MVEILLEMEYLLIMEQILTCRKRENENVSNCIDPKPRMEDSLLYRKKLEDRG